MQAQLAESESKLSQAKKAAAAATTEVQLAREGLAAAQRDRKEELAALRQQHDAAVEQVRAAAGCCVNATALTQLPNLSQPWRSAPVSWPCMQTATAHI
jgi:hypothetical protein